MPAMIFIRVDLPAPFSPISARTEPGRTRSCTSDNATTPGKPLLTLMISSRYGSSTGVAVGWIPTNGVLEAVAEANMIRYSISKVAVATLRAYCCYGADGLFERVDVLRRDQAVWHPHGLFNRLVFGHFHCRVDGAVGLTFRILEHRDRQTAFLDCVQAVRRTVDTRDQHTALVDAGLLQGHRGTNGHFVVVGHHCIELAALGQPVVDQGHAFIPQPGAG